MKITKTYQPTERSSIRWFSWLFILLCFHLCGCITAYAIAITLWFFHLCYFVRVLHPLFKCRNKTKPTTLEDNALINHKNNKPGMHCTRTTHSTASALACSTISMNVWINAPEIIATKGVRLVNSLRIINLFSPKRKKYN